MKLPFSFFLSFQFYLPTFLKTKIYKNTLLKSVSGVADNGPTSTSLILIVGKSKWNTKDSSSGMVLLTW